MGIFFAFLALAGWGIGDFLIQKSARRFGDWVTLFFISVFAGIALLPFVYRELPAIFSSRYQLFILISTGIVTLFAALSAFEALKRGKLSVVDTIWAFEVPMTALGAWFFLGEALRDIQIILIIVLTIGIAFVSIKSFRGFLPRRLEAGVLWAVLSMAGMSIMNVAYGFSARATSPLIVTWFTHSMVAIVSFLYLIATGKGKVIIEAFQKRAGFLLGMSIFDNGAWLAFAASMSLIPIGIATGISESYVAFAAALGVLVNRERLKRHQWVGFCLAVVAAIALAVVTEK